jgi:DNA modification methylase
LSPLRNRLLCIDTVEGMRALPSSSIPLTVTSPPFDDLRDYGGHAWDFEKFMLISGELWRVTMPGGVVVWVVQDKIRKGSESGTSSRQRVYLHRLGFDLHGTVILVSKGSRLPQRRRYVNQFQYAFVLSKGRPRTFNLLSDRPNSTAGQRAKASRRWADGRRERVEYERTTQPFGPRGNVWEYTVGGPHTTRDRYAYDHPALMPEAMARDLILSWSRPGDVVLDPMGGAGTTAKMALLNDRQYLSFEVHQPYHEIAARRLAEAHGVLLVAILGQLLLRRRQPRLVDESHVDRLQLLALALVSCLVEAVGQSQQVELGLEGVSRVLEIPGPGLVKDPLPFDFMAIVGPLDLRGGQPRFVDEGEVSLPQLVDLPIDPRPVEAIR